MQIWESQEVAMTNNHPMQMQQTLNQNFALLTNLEKELEQFEGAFKRDEIANIYIFA
jgi:hypothetical protein